MKAQFKHHDLRLLNPTFDSPMIDVLQKLEYLRRLQLKGTTPFGIFLQLKHIFHMLESLGSANIEGNHTTLSDLVEDRLSSGGSSDQMREIGNIERALDEIDQHITPGEPITGAFLRQLHQMVVKELVREGDKTPGAYRKIPVSISKSLHQPPGPELVQSYMEQLIDFINKGDEPKYDLMKVALAHHRFGWVHPFANGNGRVVRLLTYAMMVKFGFNIGAAGRLLNPTAVFCNDRSAYYDMLGVADRGDDDSLEGWCLYVLKGVLVELEKMEQLTKYEYIQGSILLPALAYSMDRQLITKEEYAILKLLVEKPQATLKAGDISKVLPDLNVDQRTYRIKSLLTQKLIEPVRPREYTICFASSRLLRGVVKSLRDQGFVPAPLERAGSL